MRVQRLKKDDDPYSTMVRQAEADLSGLDLREATKAAMWFFLDGTGVDQDDIMTFDGLCLSNKIDPDCAAKAVWNRLPGALKVRTVELLRAAGFNAQLPC